MELPLLTSKGLGRQLTAELSGDDARKREKEEDNCE